MNKIQLLALLLILNLTIHPSLAQVQNKFLGNNKKTKKYVASDPLDKNIVRSSHHHVKNGKNQGQALIQNQIKNEATSEQYLNPTINDVSPKSYQKEDFYLWEEGVTNLAYDDFLQTKFISNIEYLGSGYNIAYANPSPSSGIDPGYSTYKAFQMNYQSNKLNALSADAEFFIPDGVQLNSKTSCEVSFSSQQVKTVQDYSSSLQAGGSVSGGYAGFAFQASADYQQTANKLKQSNTQFISSSAHCSIYEIDINKYQQPQWTTSLKNAFTALINSNNQQDFWTFFDDFGTHVTVGVELGAKFGYNFQMDKTKVTQMVSQGLSVEVGASGYGASASANTSYQTNSKNAFSNAMQSWSQFSIGAPPNANNDALAWAASAKNSPMPIKGKFVNWADFIAYYSKSNTGFNANQLNGLANKFKTHFGTYCTGYLKPNGIVQNCQAVSIPNTSSTGSANVPGGKLLPNVDYTAVGGDNGYKWVQDTLSGVIGVAIDALGYEYAILSDQSIRYKTPGAKNWSVLSGGLRQINAANGKVVGSNSNNDIFFRDVQNGGNWIQMSGKALWISIDSNGEIWTIQTNHGICHYNDANSAAKCGGWHNGNWIANASGRAYMLYQGNREHLIYYSKSNWFARETFHQNPSYAISGCITDKGWGWKVWNNNSIWFMQDIQNNSGNINVAGSLKQIACASTTTGPQVIGIGTDNKIYKRKV